MRPGRHNHMAGNEFRGGDEFRRERSRTTDATNLPGSSRRRRSCSPAGDELAPGSGGQADTGSAASAPVGVSVVVQQSAGRARRLRGKVDAPSGRICSRPRRPGRWRRSGRPRYRRGGRYPAGPRENARRFDIVRGPRPARTAPLSVAHWQVALRLASISSYVCSGPRLIPLHRKAAMAQAPGPRRLAGQKGQVRHCFGRTG